MKKHLYIAFLGLFFFACAHAETIVLRTGARVKGTIVFQNEEVVIVRDLEGVRFQYPRTDVQEILPDEAPKAEQQVDQPVELEQIRSPKKVSALLELSGGAAVQPKGEAGGAVGADLLIGTHHIGSRHIFIGGGLGYHGLFMGGAGYNFLPIQVALRIPITESKHAPVFGAAIGYGVALSKNYQGGIYAGLDLGYRCQVNPKTAVAVVAFAQFQQVKIDSKETIEGIDFTHHTGRSLVTPGIKLALYF